MNVAKLKQIVATHINLAAHVKQTVEELDLAQLVS